LFSEEELQEKQAKPITIADRRNFGVMVCYFSKR